MVLHRILIATALVLLCSQASPTQEKNGAFVELFNGKDTTGWKIRTEKLTVTKFVDASGVVVPGAKQTKVDQKEVAQDAKGKIIADARIVTKDNKKSVVDADGNVIAGAKIAKVGGRDAVVDAKGQEIKAKAVQETIPNPLGWVAANGELVCNMPHGGNDIYTEQKFTDFELHIEFQATSNSGVYLQGRYEIQVDNSLGAKPKLIEKDGKKIESLDSHQCGAVYGRIAPSKNMAKSPKEWQSFDVIFQGARGTSGKVDKKARVTLIWNGEKVIDDAEIDGPTGAALDGKVTEPGPLLLQGDHGKVAYRNIRIRPLSK